MRPITIVRPLLPSVAFALLLAMGLATPGCKTSERTGTPSTTASTAAATDQASKVATESRVMADLRFLADDRMRGRYTGTPENALAARYIADAFAAAGAVPVSGTESMMVPVRLVEQGPVDAASLSFGESLLSFPESVLPISREAVDLEAPAIYLDHAGLDAAAPELVRGKVIITEAGGADAPADPRAWLDLMKGKRERLQGMGAVALVEIYRAGAMPFGRIVGAVNRGGMRIAPPPGVALLPTLWITENESLATYRKSVSPAPATVRLKIAEAPAKPIASDNVIAVLPGTDPALATQFIAVTAHFDHIGVTARPGQTDSINNGARDNGMGTVALLEVARAWRANPGKRPLLLMAWNAEEVGLLGSRYWAEQPTVPLSQVVFNFNLDGAGYDDTTAVTINGYGRTDVQGVVDAAIATTGLMPKPDPVPQYNLFQQSDNYSLAAVGIPAINMAPGFTGFSEELMKYYHQPADEVSAVSASYLRRYTEAAVAAVRALSNAAAAPLWNPDDEFAPRAKTLYQR